MALFSNNALTTHPYLIRMPRNDREWTGFIQALNEQSIDLSGNDADIRDIVGAMFVDSETINFTYNGSTITAVLQTSGIDHNDLSGLTAGDPHTQYLTPTRLASAFVDGTDIDFTVTVTGSPPNETVSITAEPSSNVALLNRSPQEWTGDNYFGGDLGISGSVYVQVTEAELVALGGLPTSTALNGLGSALLLGVAGGGNLRGGRVNGTLASPTAVGSGNGMFAFDTWGYDGSQMALAARINFLANGAWTGTNHGVFARLSLTERDTTELSSFVEFRYDSGAPSVRGLDGSASAPFWTFLNDTDTGIYRSAADTLGISAGGTNIASFGSSITTLSNTVLLTKSGGSLTQAALVIASASPNLLIHETDQAADAGLWVVSLAGGEFRIGAVPDNFSGSIAAESRVMNVTRSGSTVGNISLGNSSAGTIGLDSPTVSIGNGLLTFASGFTAFPTGTTHPQMYRTTTGHPVAGGLSATGSLAIVARADSNTRGVMIAAGQQGVDQAIVAAFGLAEVELNTTLVDLNGALDVSGVANFAAGTSTAPSVTFAGDTDLGFYQAQADLMGVAGRLIFNTHNLTLPSTMFGSTAPFNSDVRLALLSTSSSSIGLTLIGDLGNLAAGYRFAVAGGTISTPTATTVANAAYIGYIGGGGHDGSQWRTGAQGLIGIKPGDTWSSTQRPTRITLETTPLGSTTRRVVASFETDGSAVLGASSETPTHQLNTATSTTVGAAGSASALPTNPEGYITININGTVRHVPYYAAP